MLRLAILYDDRPRSDTTGRYAFRALQELVQLGRIASVQHLLPDEMPPERATDFDLVLCVDDGLICDIPALSLPVVFWAIDTHVSFDRCLQVARQADLTFAAQKNGVAQLQAAGVDAVHWLPLACDPVLHGRQPVPCQFDVAFVGHLFPGPREDLLELIRQQIPRCFIGQASVEDMSRIYSAARIVFNRSLRDDINMRVFEGLCSGALLITNDLMENGQADLWTAGKQGVTYRDADDLFQKLEYYLQHEEERERIAAAGRDWVLQRHTYRHRMEQVLAQVEPLLLRRTAAAVPVAPPAKGRAYFEFDRPDVLVLVPESARRVLDIGCGAGRLGAALKARQATHVTGVELNADAAAAALDQLDDVFVANLESSDLEFPPGTFDCVICADVLEHLRAPAAVLRRIHRWLSPDGTLVTSVPNVRNHTVIRSLLAGNWSYEPAGLLDEDHVRFFTRREIEKLLYRTGFEVQELGMILGPGGADWQQQGSPAEVQVGAFRLQAASSQEAAEFYAYQYLAASRPVAVPDFGLTSIVLVTHNQWGHTQACLDSLRLVTDEPYELIVVDNGSTDGTPDFLRAIPGIRLIENRENRGFPAAANQGIQAARGAQILLLNNDTLLTTGWLRRLLTALHSDPRIGLVGPVTNRSSGEQQVPVRYDDLAQLDGFAWDWGRMQAGQLQETDRLVGFCLLIKREVIERIGLLDEQFGIGNFEDDDYCRRALQAGYRCVIAREAFIHHVGSATFRGTGVDLKTLLQENQRKYVEKWQHKESALPAVGKDAPVADQATKTEAPGPQVLPEPRLGCVLAIRNRPPQVLERTLQSFARQTCQTVDQVLVDYGSGATYQAAYFELCQRYGWRLLQVAAHEREWSSAAACHLGISRLHPSVNVVFKSDVDFVLSSGVLHAAAAQGQHALVIFEQLRALLPNDGLGDGDEAAWSRFLRQRERMDGEGVQAFPRDWYDAIGGYDLTYSGWGFEDSDLRYRAEHSLGVQRVSDHLILHQWHPRAETSDSTRRNQLYYHTTKRNFTLVRNEQLSWLADLPVHELTSAPAGSAEQVSSLTLRPPRYLLESTETGEFLLQPNTLQLSGCLIVRDNEQTIRPCLESLRPWVDELIVIDTGSTDRTPQICEELGARVFHWPWQDSFARARNESFRHARGQWIFWMDSDDTLPEHCGRKLRELALGDHPAQVLGYIMQVHCPGSDPQDITAVDHVKLVRNRPDLQFEFHIHEQILPAIRRAGGEVAWTDLYVVHSGSDHSPAGRARKLQRDFKLLALDLAEHPDHPFVLFNLGMTQADAGEHAQAVQFLERCLQVSTPDESHLRKAYALLIASLMSLKRDPEAETFCRRGLRLFPGDKELLFRQAMLQHAAGRLDEAEQTYLRILQEQTPRHFASMDLGIADYKARHNLAIVYEDWGKPDIARQVWEDILQTRPDYQPARQALQRTSINHKDIRSGGLLDID